MSRAWIAFYMGDYQKKTQHLTTEQHGAYFLLLQHCWVHGAIPLEDSSRAAIARMTPSQWKKVAPVINAFFNQDGTNDRASEEIAKAEVVSIKRAMAGQKGGRQSGISKAIARGAAIKSEANVKQMLKQTPKQTGEQKPSFCEATHNHIDNLSSEAIQSESKELDGSLATAPPTGALRSPSRGAPLEASDSLKRSLAAKGVIQSDDLSIPGFLRRTQ